MHYRISQRYSPIIYIYILESTCALRAHLILFSEGLLPAFTASEPGSEHHPITSLASIAHLVYTFVADLWKQAFIL